MALEPLARAWRNSRNPSPCQPFWVKWFLNLEGHRKGMQVTDLVDILIMAKVLIIL